VPVAEPFLGEIRIVSIDWAPRGWASCNGSLLPINQNQALFALLGTTYGGDGRVNFALPDFRGRTAMHPGGSQPVLGQKGGETSHTLVVSEIPQHSHSAAASSAPSDSSAPGGRVLGRAVSPSRLDAYTGAVNPVPLAPEALSVAGGSQPHNNMQPFLVLNFIIAMQGIFPSRD
jgi:microcystin-dependent protein